MKIYGYPKERVDFVSKSGGAGSLVFGDSRQLAEEFFGAPHAVEGTDISYFSGSLVLSFSDGALSAVTVFPGKSRHEKVDVYVGKTRLSEVDPQDLAAGVDAVVRDGAVEQVSFTG